MEPAQKGLKERIVIIANEAKIVKTGENTFSDYEYIKPGLLLNVLKPLLLKYHVFNHFEGEELEDGKTKYTLRLEDFDSEVAITYTMTVEAVVVKGANAVQGKGAQRTYVYRYLLMTAFDIADDNDDLDSDHMSKLTKTDEDVSKKEPSQKKSKKSDTPKSDPQKEAESESKEIGHKEVEPRELVCEECHSTIIPTTSNTIEEVIEIGKSKHGKQLCAKCIRTLNKKVAEAAKTPETKLAEDETDGN